MNFKSLVFRHGSKYLTCWMLDGCIRLNDVVEFFPLGPPLELARHLEQLAQEMPKKLLRYSFNFSSGYFPGSGRDDYFCAPRDVRYIVREVQKRAKVTLPNTGNGVDAANEHMLEQLIEQCDDLTVVRAAATVYGLADLVHNNEVVRKKLKRKHPAVAAALESVSVDEDQAGPPQPRVAKKKARPYDLYKSSVPAPLTHTDADEIECETFHETEE